MSQSNTVAAIASDLKLTREQISRTVTSMIFQHGFYRIVARDSQDPGAVELTPQAAQHIREAYTIVGAFHPGAVA